MSLTNATPSGETNLQTLLQKMSPVLNTGVYVFCTVPPEKLASFNQSDILGFFRESSSQATVFMSKDFAVSNNLDFPTLLAWITLKVHSSLEAVGLTAAFSTALGKAGISCNVIAGYFHDHIFVPLEDANRAIAVLEKLSSAPETCGL